METLAFYDVATVSNPTTLSLGTAAPGSSDDILLRVSNLSDLYQAEDVTVEVAGTDSLQLWLSLDGDVFVTGIAVGDIPAGGSSQPFWLRRVTASDAAPGGYQAVLSATPTGWTHPVDTSASVNIALDTDPAADAPAPLTFTYPPQNYTVGESIDLDLTDYVSGGTPPYTVYISSDHVPAGIDLVGEWPSVPGLSGTFTAAGHTGVIVFVRNAGEDPSANVIFTFDINVSE